LGSALDPNRGLRPVPAQDRDIVVHRKHDAADRIHEVVERAAREITAADRTLEDQIAREQDPVGDEHTVAGRVPRGVANGQLDAAEVELIVVCEVADVGRHADVELAEPHPSERSTGIVEHVAIGRVDVSGNTRAVSDARGIPDVIDMAVRQKNGFERQAVRGKPLGRNFCGILTGVDQDRAAARARSHDVGVRLEHPERVALDDALIRHGGILPASPETSGLCEPNAQVVIVAAVEAMRAIRLIAFGRAAFGLALTMKTEPMLRAMDRDTPAEGSLVMWARTVGIRDLVLGVGTLAATFAGISETKRWASVCLASDAIDTAAGTLSSPYIGRGGAAKAVGASLPFVAGGAWALLRLPAAD